MNQPAPATLNEDLSLTAALEVFSDPQLAEYARYAAQQAFDGQTYDIEILAALKRYPVSIEEFVLGDEYLGMKESIYPEVLRTLVELNNPQVVGLSHGIRVGSTYSEAVLTGAIGVAKSTIAIISTAYQVYVISCLNNPQTVFGIDPSSEILFVFQSINAALAKQVDYERFKALIEGSSYFRTEFPSDINVKSELRFPNRIIVRPVSGLETATIGQNVFGGCFPPDQQFLTADGRLVTFGSVKGRPISVLTPTARGLRESPTTRVVCTGTKSLLRLSMENGNIITCTPDQKFKGERNEWISARDAAGRYLRFTRVQTLREQGHLSYPAPDRRPSDVRQGLQEAVSRGAADRKKDDRVPDSQECKWRPGTRGMSNLWSTFTDDFGKAPAVPWDNACGIPGGVSRITTQDKGGEANAIGKGPTSCIPTTQRPRVQGEPATWDKEGPASWMGGKSKTLSLARSASRASAEIAGDMADHGLRRTSTSLAHLQTSELSLRLEGQKGGAALKAGDRSGLQLRRIGVALGIRARFLPLHFQRPGEVLRAGLLGPQTEWVRRGQKPVHPQQRAIQRSGEIRCPLRSGLSNHRRGDSKHPDGKDTALARQEPATARDYQLRDHSPEVGRIRCVRIEELTGSLQPVYDVENAGYTHTFLVNAGAGFLHAKNCLDEVNYMEVTHRSRKSVDGDTYDQAIALYNSIARRRKSRFMKQGRLPGLVSSKRYPGQFTDQKEAEAKKELAETGSTSIYVYDKRTWDIKPDTFTGEWFQVYPGDQTRKPRIIEPGEEVSEDDQSLVVDIPVEYRQEFEVDIMKALRDIAGVSTVAIHPFMMDTEAVSACFGQRASVLSRPDTDFDQTTLLLYPKFIEAPKSPRFAHVDLALTRDSAGVVVGHVPRFVSIQRGEETEILPQIVIDFALEVRPPKGGEILISRIRELFYKLREHGMNLKWISFDGYQSADSIQILQAKGFTTGIRSVDRSPAPYDITKTALYDGRVEIPEHSKLLKELTSLEVDSRTGKVDHPVNGSKDVADGLAGVVHGLTMRREVWARHQMLHKTIPSSIRECLSNADQE